MKKLIFLVFIFLFGLLCNTKQIYCCGPFFESPVFTYNLNPDIPLDNFPKGKLGVILPSFARSYLYVAYRQLMGKGFSQEEQNALLDFWNTRLRLEWRGSEENLPEIWLNARSKVPQAGPSPKINVYSDESYSAYLKYTEDAFRNAALTLEDRIKRFGPDSPQVLEWVKAQDMVFSGSIPEPLKEDIDPLIRADRAYQIAAANFYAGNFDLAIDMFKEISRDNSSPWQKIAPYLVARALIRKGTLNTESNFDRDLLTQALDQLKMILDNNNLKDMHQASRKLLGFVNYRLEPNITLHELSKTLMNEKPGDDIKLYLGDYVKLLDIFMNEQNESVFWWTPEEREKSRIDSLQKLEKLTVNDDLTDWIITFQTPGDIALNRSLEKWKKSQSLPWLIASLAKINPGHLEAPELLREGEKIKADSPAFSTVAFHSIRLMIESGKAAEAIKKLDSILSTTDSSIPVSSRNLLLAERMKVAGNLDEFLKYAVRIPVGITYDIAPVQYGYDEAVKKYQGVNMLDIDSIRIMDGTMPLGLLKDIASSKILPDELRQKIAIATWTRSALLENYKICSEVTPVLKGLVPELEKELDSYISAKDNASRQFAAIFLMLKYPGMQPDIVSTVRRETPLKNIDNYRNNWWCSFGEKDQLYKTISTEEPLRMLYPSGIVESPKFVTGTQTEMAKDEWTKLKALPTGPNHLCARVIDWATKNPRDPRVPEALHLAVRSTRYGCTDDNTTKFSKQAFQLLHKNYPKSEWAAKTKYWF